MSFLDQTMQKQPTVFAGCKVVHFGADNGQPYKSAAFVSHLSFRLAIAAPIDKICDASEAPDHSLYADLLDAERPIKKTFEEEYGMRAEIHFCAPGEVSPALGDQYFPYFGAT